MWATRDHTLLFSCPVLKISIQKICTLPLVDELQNPRMLSVIAHISKLFLQIKNHHITHQTSVLRSNGCQF